MINKIKKKNGVTLVELIIALTLLTLVISLGMNFLLTGSKVFSKGSSQYNIQSSVRFASANISDMVRFASSIEILAANPNTLTDPYDYIYLDSGDLIHSFINDAGNRAQRILAYDLTALSFENNSVDEQLLGLVLTGIENAQEYQIDLGVALPNFSILNQQITGESSGLALMFYRDRTDIAAGSPTTLAISPGTDFNLLQNDTVNFYANKNVTWSSSSPSVISVSQTGSMTATATASNSVGSSTTITATTVDEDPQQSRSVTVTIVEQSNYTVEVVRNDYSSIDGDLNITRGDTKIVRLVFTPALESGVDIINIIWDTVYLDTETGYLTVTPDDTDPTISEIIGNEVGENANLTAKVELSDGSTTIYDSIIVNVMALTEPAELTRLDFDKGTLSPGFNTGTYSYTNNHNGSNAVIITVDAPAGATISIGGNILPKGAGYDTGYNHKNDNWAFTIKVEETGKSTSYYNVSKN